MNDNRLNSAPTKTQPWLFAHRGTSTLAPENTAAAFELAAEANADVLEIDVRISADKQVIVTHDKSVKRTTNGYGAVAKHSLKQLKRLDTGYHFQDEYGKHPWRNKGLTLLTLAELFAQFPDVGINIDIKDKKKDAALLVSNELTRLQDGRWLNVGSFYAKTINAFREFAPEISTAASQWDVANLYFGRWLPTQLHEKLLAHAGGNVLQIPTHWWGIPLARSAFIHHVQGQQKKVMYWTINDPSDMAQLLAKGVNGIVSDNIFEARKAINQHAVSQI